MFTVKLTRGKDREIVGTQQLSNAPTLTLALEGAKKLLQKMQQGGYQGAPDGYLIFDEHGRKVASDLTRTTNA